MKKVMVIALVLASGMAAAQNYEIGDTLKLARGSAHDGTFVYVTNMGFPALPKLAGTEVIVRGIKEKKGQQILIVDAGEFANLKVYIKNALWAKEITTRSGSISGTGTDGQSEAPQANRHTP